MSILKMEGFDFYIDGADIFSNGWSTNDNESNFTIDTTGGRFGGPGLNVSSSFEQDFSISFSESSTVRVAFWFKSITVGSDTFIKFQDDFFSLSINSSKNIVANFAEAPSIITEAKISGGVWNWIELEVVYGDPGSIKLYLNGAKILDRNDFQTSADFGDNGWFGVTLRARGNSDTTYDDIIIWDDDGVGLSTFPLGPQRIVFRQPNADGATTNFTPLNSGANYEEVDESPNDGDTTYNSSGTVGDRDLFTLPALPTDVSAITAVQQVNAARKDGASTRTLSGVISSGATMDVGSAEGLVEGSYTFLTRILANNPNTSAAWAISEIEAVEFGYEVAG